MLDCCQLNQSELRKVTFSEKLPSPQNPQRSVQRQNGLNLPCFFFCFFSCVAHLNLLYIFFESLKMLNLKLKIFFHRHKHKQKVQTFTNTHTKMLFNTPQTRKKIFLKISAQITFFLSSSQEAFIPFCKGNL